jgi:hypothetical protein
MQFNSDRVWYRFSFRYALLACISAVAVVGCASDPAGVQFESRSVASRLGLPSCDVSVALSPSEVIENSKRSGNPNPEENDEWIKMVASLKSGDQLRLVNCLGVKGIGDPYYYALFRNGEIISKFHPMIFN